jgi:hypothetical protein
MYLKRFVHDNAEDLYQTGCLGDLMVVLFHYFAS